MCIRDSAEDFALGDLEADVAHGGNRPVVLGKAFNREDRRLSLIHISEPTRPY